MSSNKSEFKNYKWGIGIEHETHIFHNPFSGKLYSYDNLTNKKNNKIDSHILFNSEDILKKLIYDRKRYKISRAESKFLDTGIFSKNSL